MLVDSRFEGLYEDSLDAECKACDEINNKDE